MDYKPLFAVEYAFPSQRSLFKLPKLLVYEHVAGKHVVNKKLHSAYDDRTVIQKHSQNSTF
jgi:hypothetical protein